MAAVNLEKDHAWGNIFFKTGAAPTLPEQLTSKWWSKKKQLLASGKETGMGDALDQVITLFKAVQFPSVSGRNDLKEHDSERCRESMNSSAIKAFVKQLGVVQKIAQEHAKNFKGGTKKTGEALEEIGEVAAAVAEMCSTHHLEQCLENALNDAVDQKFQAILKNAALVIEARDGVLKKLPAALENIKKLVNGYVLDRKPKSGQDVGSALSKLCRDLTQVIFNLVKLEEGNFKLENFRADDANRVSQYLEKWGDAKTAITYDRPEDAVADVKEVGACIMEYIPLVKSVKLPKAG